MGNTARVKNDFLERVINVLSPAWAVERASKRLHMEILERAFTYDAAGSNRQFNNWHTPIVSSGSSATRGSLLWLRERSRDLVRNNPYAKKAIQVLTTNCIGNGIQPSIPKNLLTKTQEAKLMNAWRLWAGSKDCDYIGKKNFYMIQMQAWRAVCETGEVFIRVIVDKKLKFPLKLQLLEADFCDHNKDGYPSADGGYVNQGVEFDKLGKIVAYWMYEKHPADLQPYSKSLLSTRVPANEIIHVYEELRPGQVRGIPQGVAAITRLKNLDDYEEAELVRQKIASCYTVNIRKNDPNFIDAYIKTEADRGPYDQLSEKVAPGMINYLAPGEDIAFTKPPVTNGQEQYVQAIIRSIAVAYGVTYESISGDLSRVNFSSGRMGWLEMHRQVMQWQNLVIIPLLCDEVWNKFNEIALILGVAPKLIAAEWTPPRREMIDPLKEAHGLLMQMRAGIISKAEVIRQLGYDPELVAAEIIAEQKISDDAGQMLESDPKWDAARVNYGFEKMKELKQIAAAKAAKAAPLTK